jgi:hypothetical protein
VRPPLALVALVLALAVPARGAEGDVRLRLVLHGYFTDRENTPDPAVLYDRAARTFAIDRYLRPAGSDAHGSAFLSAAAEGQRGWFRWGLAADTGELRQRRFPLLSSACPSSRTATGLDVVGSGNCNVLAAGRRAVDLVEDTRLASAQLTANGQPLGDELSSTLLLREAWVGAVMGRNDFALVKAGRKRFTVADGFVYDDFGTGVDASFDLGALGPSFDLGAALFYPSREFPGSAGVESGMLAVRADWLPSLFEHAGLFLALYRDRGGNVAELFRGALAETSVVRLQGIAPGTARYRQEARDLAGVLAVAGSERRPLALALDSDATLAWIGTSGRLALGDLARLEWTGALGLGRLTIRAAPQELRSTVSGQLAWVRVRRAPTPALELSAFFLFLSGDVPPTEKERLGLSPRYGGFLGVAPFVTTTNVFFSGGVDETFAARRASAPGVNGRGVVAPGVGAAWDPVRGLGLDARAAYLVADERGPFGGRLYGPELDVEVSWSPLRWLTFAAEADALFPGDFFPGRATVTKVVVGTEVIAP